MFDIFHCWHVKRSPLENPEKIVPLRTTELDMVQMNKNMRHYLDQLDEDLRDYIEKFIIPNYPEIAYLIS